MNRMTLQAALAAVLAACTASSSASDNPSGDGKRPFTIGAVSKFDNPWAMAFLTGSGRSFLDAALVTEKDGRLWLVSTGDGKRWPVTGVPAVLAAGQGGLGDVAVHPSFVTNRRIYLSFVEAGSGGTAGAALGYGMLDLTDKERPALRGFKIVWRQEPKVSGRGHYSHRIAFAPDGTLFLSSGDRQKMQPAQALDGNLGKILHLDDEGRPVAGNPWAERGGVAGQYWTIGHRNALGLAFAPDGRLWATEMGPRGGDELNLIERGRNYGWPIVSNGSHYDLRGIPDHDSRPDFAAPKLWWNPSISPAGMIIYSGDLFAGWKGDAIFGALSGEALVRADLDGAQARKAEQWPMAARIREVEQGPCGEIYLLEDEGRLLRLEPAR